MLITKLKTPEDLFNRLGIHIVEVNRNYSKSTDGTVRTNYKLECDNFYLITDFLMELSFVEERLKAAESTRKVLSEKNV